jgi:hypothetical protein
MSVTARSVPVTARDAQDMLLPGSQADLALHFRAFLVSRTIQGG